MSNGEESKANNTLGSALSELEVNWQERFNFKTEDKDLKIIPIHPKQITDQMVEDMSRDFAQKLKDKHYTDFDHLHISLESCENVTDDGVKQLAYNIGPKTDAIKKVSWSFLCGKKLTDEGLKTFMCAITPYAKDLEYLSLNFTGCEKITDEGVRQVADEFKHVRNLEELYISLTGCPLVTNQGINHLSTNIVQDLQNLKRLEIVVRNCEKLTGEGIKALGANLSQKLVKLEGIVLNIGNCEQIHIEDIDSLKETLQANGKLKSQVLL